MMPDAAFALMRSSASSSVAVAIRRIVARNSGMRRQVHGALERPGGAQGPSRQARDRDAYSGAGLCAFAGQPAGTVLNAMRGAVRKIAQPNIEGRILDMSVDPGSAAAAAKMLRSSASRAAPESAGSARTTGERPGERKRRGD